MMRRGDVLCWERTFTEEDVRSFAELSGDRGAQHLQPDEQGRLIVQGLLTATLPTRVGGMLDLLAREMVFQFLRPVYTGEPVRCEVTILDLTDSPRGTWMSAHIVCRTAEGQEVLAGHARGVIPRPLEDVLALPLDASALGPAQ